MIAAAYGAGAMEPHNPNYEILRQAQQRAVQEQQDKRDAGERQQAVEKEQALVLEKERSARAQEKERGADRQEYTPEQLKRHAWQMAEYERRQREAADEQRRKEARAEYMKVHDPREYARQQADDRRRAARAEQEKDIKERANKSPGQDRDNAREKGEAAQAREGNKWRAAMSEQKRAAIDRMQAQERQGIEREGRRR